MGEEIKRGTRGEGLSKLWTSDDLGHVRFARVKWLVSWGFGSIISRPYQGKQCNASNHLWLVKWSGLRIQVYFIMDKGES